MRRRGARSCCRSASRRSRRFVCATQRECSSVDSRARCRLDDRPPAERSAFVGSGASRCTDRHGTGRSSMHRTCSARACGTNGARPRVRVQRPLERCEQRRPIVRAALRTTTCHRGRRGWAHAAILSVVAGAPCATAGSARRTDPAPGMDGRTWGRRIDGFSTSLEPRSTSSESRSGRRLQAKAVTASPSEIAASRR